MTEEERAAVLGEIINREWKMFQATPSEDGEPAIKDRPEAFRLTRLMAHAAHGDEFLNSYLDDLREAEKTGRNFIVEKYGRLNNVLPPLNESPLLDEIADAETAFLSDASKMFPDIIKNTGSDKYRQYLRAELESLSDKSLALYADEIRKAKAQGLNPALDRHNWLAAMLGREPLRY